MPDPKGKSANVAPAFYRGGVWKLGLAAARIFPAALLKNFAMLLAELYLWLQPRRVEVVLQNFLPVFNGDRAAAEEAVCAAHHGGCAHAIGETDTGADVELLYLQNAGGSTVLAGEQDRSVDGVEVRLAIVALGRRSKQIPAQSCVHCQPA